MKCLDKSLDNTNIPWRRMAKQFQSGTLEPGMYVIIKGKSRDRYFFQDAILAMEIEKGHDAYYILPLKHRPYINQAVENARELLVENCLIEGTGMVYEREVETLEDMLAELEKIGYHGKDSRVVAIEGIEGLKGENGRKATDDDIRRALDDIKHLAFDYDLTVLVCVEGAIAADEIFPSFNSSPAAIEQGATAAFSIANTRDKVSLENAGYKCEKCEESYGLDGHKNIFVQIIKNQTGISGCVFGI